MNDADNFKPKSPFIKELITRGFLYQHVDIEELDNKMCNESVTAYIGFDCTATSLHVGSLVQIMIFRLLQKHGHKPIVLMGGGTTKIGDPTGKDEARKILTDEDIEKNMNGIKKAFEKFIKFGSGPSDAIMVNNIDWLSKINYLDFLRDFGRHISVNRMLSMDSVRTRLEREQNLSFLEFNYMLMQAYDFVYLNKHNNCILQFGGSEQWSNIINGVELCRKLGLKKAFAITTPLITTSFGKKMGKTEGGAVWLNEDMKSPYDYWQFWRNTDDADVMRFFKMFTDLNESELEEVNKIAVNNINEAKILLANEATKMCHGEEAAKQSYITAQNTFGGNKTGEGLPEFGINLSDDGILLYEIMRDSKLAESGGEAKRLIKSGAVKLDDIAINDEFYKVAKNNFDTNEKIKLSVGKKKHILLKLE